MIIKNFIIYFVDYLLNAADKSEIVAHTQTGVYGLN